MNVIKCLVTYVTDCMADVILVRLAVYQSCLIWVAIDIVSFKNLRNSLETSEPGFDKIIRNIPVESRKFASYKKACILSIVQ